MMGIAWHEQQTMEQFQEKHPLAFDLMGCATVLIIAAFTVGMIWQAVTG